MFTPKSLLVTLALSFMIYICMHNPTIVAIFTAIIVVQWYTANKARVRNNIDAAYITVAAQLAARKS